MALQTKPYKGARDFYPEDKRLQSLIFSRLSDVCERYGYEAYDAPILEPTELYLSKGNEEIIEQQTYTFTDRGDRSVTLRTEMTPSVSRMVAGRRQELGYPLRWYSIPQCWRYERMQRGRGREFYQLNVDIFGDDSVTAELELLLVVRDIFASFGASESHYSIRVSSRAFMRRVFKEVLRLSEQEEKNLSQLIDRIHKIDERAFDDQLSEVLSGSQAPESAPRLIRSILGSTTLTDLPDEVRDFDELQPLRELFGLAEKSGLHAVSFDPTIMRGFDYYTDIVFEVFDLSPDNNRAMFGGGRYDSLISDFGVEPVPTVGFGMGDITLVNFLETHQLLPDAATATDVYLICVGDVYDGALEVATALRAEGIRVAIDSSERKLDKCIKTADKKQIPYVLFVGEQELAAQTYALKDLRIGAEQSLSIDDVVSTVSPSR